MTSLLSDLLAPIRGHSQTFKDKRFFFCHAGGGDNLLPNRLWVVSLTKTLAELRGNGHGDVLFKVQGQFEKLEAYQAR